MSYKDPKDREDYAKKYRKKNKKLLNKKQRDYRRIKSQDEGWVENRREEQRKRLLTFNFNITPEQYDELLSKQNGVCAICQKPCPTGRNLAVDHDRTCCPGNKSCGKCVRELLCVNCNQGLGKFKESEEFLYKASEYLKRWRR
jgi:hypothetical protein